MSPRFAVAGILLLLVLLLLSNSVYVVMETERAVKLRFGELVEDNIPPGIHVKYPLADDIRKFDARILTLDAETESFFTSERKRLMVDSYAKWRIADVAQFFRSTRGSGVTASRLLSERINAALRDEFGKRTVQDVISGERTEIMQMLAKEADSKASDLGVEIVDVRIKQIDFPRDISDRIYERMRTERQRVASELRAEGREAAERIRADADRQRTEIVANAYRDSELLRGEGDAKAAETYAQAFEENDEFYAFWRSLGAYRGVFEQGSSMMVLDPDSTFFRYFRSPEGSN